MDCRPSFIYAAPLIEYEKKFTFIFKVFFKFVGMPEITVTQLMEKCQVVS